ncbi:Ser/Thr protein phosphatase superfamily [Xylariaceae sp. FL1019]|nr:Ser/Thr protein phosphatase superfamily [Xylariaceae sp. FL1019]
MAQLQVLSDLHLESPKAYEIFSIPPKAPSLALLGDIGYAVKHESDYHSFLRRHLAHFRTILLVMGNHEPWHSNWDKATESMRAFEAEIRAERKKDPACGLGEFVLMDRTRYDIKTLGSSPENAEEETVIVLGCVLFSHVPEKAMEDVSLGLQDFYVTEHWTVEEHNNAFQTDLSWLNVAAIEQEKQQDGKERKIIILTHHSPTMEDQANDPVHAGSKIQAGFVTDVSQEGCWKSPLVKVWAFGHTHYNCDFVLEEGRLRVLANQKGYYGGRSNGFDIEKVVQI